MRGRLAILAFLLVCTAAFVWWLAHRVGAASSVASATPCASANNLGGADNINAGQMGGLGGGLAGGSETAAPTLAPCASAAPSAQDPLIADLAILYKALPQEDLDVGARATSTATEQNAFAFVRDGIRLDSYTGVLRGATGTLLEYAGNADDKALLLAALLQKQGATVRFARSTLSDNEAASLATAAAAPATPAPLPTIGPDALAALGLTQNDLARAAAQASSQTSGALPAAVALGAQQAAAFASQLTGGKTPLVPSASVPFDKTHYYVQIQQNGNWVDLDPMPGVAFGSHLGSADASFDGSAIPDARYASVTFTLTATQAGSATPQSVLTSTAKVADLAGGSEHLFVTADGTNDFAKNANASVFNPSLHAPGGVVSGSAIDLGATGNAQVTAVDFTIASTSPSGTTRTYVRRIFARTPNEGTADAALALSNAYDIIVTAGDFNPSFELATKIATAGESIRPSSDEPPMPLALVQLFHLDAMYGRALATRYNGVRFTPDRAMIAMVHRGFDASKAPTLAIDIVENGERAGAADPSSATLANVARGYMDTVAEQHLLNGTAVGAPQIFAAAAKTNVASSVLPPSGAAQVAALPFDAATRAQLGATLSGGAAAIVTQQAISMNGAPHVAWWSIDPSSGNTVGRMETGAGQGMTEYNQLQAKIASKGGPLVEAYGDFWRCIAWGVEAPLEGAGGESGEVEFLTCIANGYCHLLSALLLDQIEEGKAPDPMLAESVQQALMNVLEARARAFVSANAGKGKLAGGLSAACDAAFSSPFKT